MTLRRRGLLAAALGVVLLLFVGRWLAASLAEYWWAVGVSPEAAAAVRRWHWMGLALDIGATTIATLWFAVQVRIALRPRRRTAPVQPDDAVTPPALIAPRGRVILFVLACIALGLTLGSDASAWRAPLALSRATVALGVNDPLLGVDLGDLISRVPLWRELLGFWVTLSVAGVLLTAAIYLSIGAFHRHEGRLEVHPDARRHLGGLLAVLAASVALGYLLVPYRLATSADVPLGLAAASTRILAAHAAAGAAIAVAAMSIAWALRGRLTLLLAGWSVLALVAATERFLVPAFIADSTPATERAAQRRLIEHVTYLLQPIDATAEGDSLPRVTTVLEPGLLAAWAGHRGERMIDATPIDSAQWLVVTEHGGEAPRLLRRRLRDGVLDGAGSPVVVDSQLVNEARSYARGSPTEWLAGAGGIPAGNLFRRAALAWALQAPGILRRASSDSLDWHLAPADRAAALIPVLRWHTVRPVVVDGELTWVVSGVALIGRAPLATRIRYGTTTVSGVVPAMVALVRASDGQIRFFRDPAGHPLGEAWSTAFQELVQPATELPATVVDRLGYPPALYGAQLDVLSQPHWDLGLRVLGVGGDSDTGYVQPLPVGAPGELEASLEDAGRGRTVAVVRAERRGGGLDLLVERLGDPAMPAARDLAGAWQRMPALQQLLDSVQATGDSLRPGSLRWHAGAGGWRVWAPFYTTGGRVLWVGTAWLAGIGGSRRPESAWGALGSGPDDVPVPDATSRLEAVRTWMRRADSALARGDLTAFGRAWEALRGLLEASPRE